MISLNQAAPEIARLAVFPNFPEYKEGRGELIQTLQQIAVSDEHARAIIGLAMERCKFSPVPSELRELANETRDRFRAPSPEACGKCFDGFISGLWLVTQESGRTWRERIGKEQARTLGPKLIIGRQGIYEAATFCDCALGRRRQDLEQLRQQYEAAEQERTSARYGKVQRAGLALVKGKA